MLGFVFVPSTRQLPVKWRLCVLSLNFLTNFREQILCNWSSKMLEIFPFSMLWHALCWDIFLSQSDLNFLSQDFFKWNVQTHVQQKNFIWAAGVEILTHSLLRLTIYCDIFCYQSNVNFLSFDDIAFFSLNSQRHFRPNFFSNFSSQML